MKSMSSLFQVLLAVLIATSGVSCRRSTEVSTIPELEAELEREVSKKHLTSISYCVVNGDEVLYSNAQGLADEDNNRAATDSTRYLIASFPRPSRRWRSCSWWSKAGSPSTMM